MTTTALITGTPLFLRGLTADEADIWVARVGQFCAIVGPSRLAGALWLVQAVAPDPTHDDFQPAYAVRLARVVDERWN